jgi:hypothetical protein
MQETTGAAAAPGAVIPFVDEEHRIAGAGKVLGGARAVDTRADHGHVKMPSVKLGQWSSHAASRVAMRIKGGARWAR